MIAVNCRFLTQDVTGVQRYAEEITRELVTMRDDLRLVAPQGELRHQEIGGRGVEQIGSASGHLWEQWDLPRALRDWGSPLLLSLMNTGPVLYRNQIITHHDVTYVRFPGTYTTRFRIAYRLLSHLALRRARQIITVSEFSKSEIADVYGVPTDKIVVAHNAVNDAFRQPHVGTEPPYMLAVASFLPHKNIDWLVHGFERYVQTSGSATRLKLVGSARPSAIGRDGGPRRESDTVELMGRVDDATLCALYAGARGFVFPSLYEGFGIPPLEAQASGTPVAAADIPPIREALGESALYFDVADQESFVTALGRLDEDEGTRMHLGLAGARNLDRFSWAASAARISAALDEGVISRR